MPEKQLSLYQSATGRLRVSRMGPLTMMIIDGQGMAVCLTEDFSGIEKWAKSRPSGPNATIDSARIVEKVEVLISRPGTSFASTRGSIKPMEKLLKAMKSAGMDTKEFQLPPELKDGYKSPEELAKERNKKIEDEAARKAAEEAAAAKPDITAK